MKTRPRDILKDLQRQLRAAPPKSRERIRLRVQAFEKVLIMRKRPKAA